MRIDVYLLERGLVKSRQKARDLILQKRVSVDGRTVEKPAFEVGEGACVVIAHEGFDDYVGRGGLKLAKALDVFGVEAAGRVCLDAGASTGGFCDCLLRRGAAKIYAVDVGHGQLDPAIAADPRVLNMEGFNIRDLAAGRFDEQPEIIVSDLSFISTISLFELFASVFDSFEAVFLIKPQFEAGRRFIGKGGIVKSAEAHREVLRRAFDCAVRFGYEVGGLCFSPVRGGAGRQGGNIEYLLHLKRFSRKNDPPVLDNVPNYGIIDESVDAAFDFFAGR